MAAVTSPTGWDEAARGVGEWLESLGVRPEERKLKLALRILQKARKKKAKGEPLATAMDTAFETLEAWAAPIFPQLTPEQARVQALLALEGIFPAEQAGELVLSAPFPEKLAERLRQFSHGGGPEIRLSKMTARGIRYGPMEAVAQETWHRFAWTPFFGALFLWTGVFYLMLFLLGRGR